MQAVAEQPPRAGPGFVWGIQVPDDLELALHASEDEEAPEIEIRPVPLPLASYRRPTSLGRFTVRAVYHDTATIADEDAYADRIVHRSDPLDFEWTPRKVLVTDEVEARIRGAIEALLEAEEVKVTRFHLPAYQQPARKTAPSGSTRLPHAPALRQGPR